jgi:hypothetical protein
MVASLQNECAICIKGMTEQHRIFSKKEKETKKIYEKENERKEKMEVRRVRLTEEVNCGFIACAQFSF